MFALIQFMNINKDYNSYLFMMATDGKIVPCKPADYNTWVRGFNSGTNPGFYPGNLVWTSADNNAVVYDTPTVTAAALANAISSSTPIAGMNGSNTQLKPTSSTKVGVSGMQSFARIGNILLTKLATRIGTWVANWNGSQTTLNSLRASNDLQFDMWNQKLEEFKNISTKNLANEIGKGQRTIQIDELILNNP